MARGAIRVIDALQDVRIKEVWGREVRLAGYLCCAGPSSMTIFGLAMTAPREPHKR